VLDTLDAKLQVEANYQSGSLPPAFEQPKIHTVPLGTGDCGSVRARPEGLGLQSLAEGRDCEGLGLQSLWGQRDWDCSPWAHAGTAVPVPPPPREARTHSCRQQQCTHTHGPILHVISELYDFLTLGEAFRTKPMNPAGSRPGTVLGLGLQVPGLSRDWDCSPWPKAGTVRDWDCNPSGGRGTGTAVPLRAEGLQSSIRDCVYLGAGHTGAASIGSSTVPSPPRIYAHL